MRVFRELEAGSFDLKAIFIGKSRKNNSNISILFLTEDDSNKINFETSHIDTALLWIYNKTGVRHDGVYF